MTGDYLLTGDQLADLEATRADLVLVAPGWTLSDLAPALTWGSADPTEERLRAADCADPDAVAAEGIRSGGSGYLALDPAATVCFPAAAPDAAGLRRGRVRGPAPSRESTTAASSRTSTSRRTGTRP